MRGLRLAAVLTGLGAVITCGQVRAVVLPPDPVTEEAPVVETSASALALLEHAATVAQARPWTGTERVMSMASGSPVVSVTTVQHGPGSRSAADAVDERLFSLLATHYAVELAGPGVYDGREAQQVLARRYEDGTVAGRFWVDAATGLLLCREVLDQQGSVLRRTDLVGVQMGVSPAAVTTDVSTPQGDRVDEAGLARFQDQGWPVQRELPGDLELYDARWLNEGLLQLAYSDGLSTLSLFLQRGEMPPTEAGVLSHVGGGTVWKAPGEPERVVWAGGGFTWTLVSDVSPATADEVVALLPHTPEKTADEGLGQRIWRGMSRVGSWLNPFH